MTSTARWSVADHARSAPEVLLTVRSALLSPSAGGPGRAGAAARTHHRSDPIGRRNLWLPPHAHQRVRRGGMTPGEFGQRRRPLTGVLRPAREVVLGARDHSAAAGSAAAGAPGCPVPVTTLPRSRSANTRRSARIQISVDPQTWSQTRPAGSPVKYCVYP